VTDKRQTQPLVREGAPQRQNSNFQTENNIWSQVPEWTRHQDILTDWPSVVTWLWLWRWLVIPNPMPTLFLGEINTGTWPSTLGNLRNRDNRIWPWVPWDWDPRKAVLAMRRKNWKLKTRLLVREGAPHQQIRICLKIIKEIKRKIVRGFQMGAWHQERLADWPSVVI
jgi:hypothetical protein